MSEYLRVFMNTVTSSYRISELIHSGKFKLETQKDSVAVSSFKNLLNLVPVIGKTLNVIANQVDSQVKGMVQGKIKSNASNTVESFYNKEIEQLTEYVAITHLYQNGIKVKQKIQVEYEEKRTKKEEYSPYSWVESKLNEATKAISTDLNVYKAHQFLMGKYKEPAEILAYKDGWFMVEAIGNGEFIEQIGTRRLTILRNQKIEKMMDILAEAKETSTDEMQEKEFDTARGYL